MDKITITTADLLTTEEAREILGVSRVHIWRLTKKGKLTPLYFGNRPYFSKRDVEDLAIFRGLPSKPPNPK